MHSSVLKVVKKLLRDIAPCPKDTTNNIHVGNNESDEILEEDSAPKYHSDENSEQQNDNLHVIPGVRRSERSRKTPERFADSNMSTI